MSNALPNILCIKVMRFYELVFLGIILVNVSAQEYSRQSLTSSEMVRVLNRTDRYNLRIGGVKLQVDGALQGELNDNINLESSKGALSDIIFRPGAEIKSDWQVTEGNKISGTLGISYAKYLAHPEFDSKMPLVSPNSEMAFIVAIGDVRIKLYDRFRIQEDPASNAQLNNVVSFRRFENDMGTLVDWDLNQFILTWGYEWGTFLALESTYDSLQRDTQTFSFEPKYLINEAITVGLNNRYTMIDYEKNIQNDSVSWTSGPFVEAQLTKQTSVRLEVGYQQYESDAGGTIQDSSSFSSGYGRLSIRNRMNKYMNHELSVVRMAEGGIGSNYVDRTSVDYGLDWKIVKDTGLRTSLFYEFFESSGVGQEKADRYGMMNRLSYPLTISTMVALEYRVTYKDSDQLNKDYIQNVTSAIVSYSF